MRQFSRAVLASLSFFALQAQGARAEVLIRVDLGRQQMTVDVGGKGRHVWPVSTGRAGYGTPTGAYRPQRMHKIWYSKKYDDAPMPHSIFYSGGFAIHATDSVKALGRPASHGCVRLSPSNAQTLFALVKREGMARTRIVVHGTPPPPLPAAVVAKARTRQPAVVRVRVAPPGNLFSELFGGPVVRPARPAMRTTYGTVSRGTITYYRVPTYRAR